MVDSACLDFISKQCPNSSMIIKSPKSSVLNFSDWLGGIFYECFEYLSEKIPKHMDDKYLSFCEDLLPWSPNLPEKGRKTIKILSKYERTICYLRYKKIQSNKL